MLQPNQQAPAFSLPGLDQNEQRYEAGKPALLIFFETDCPTCRLTFPYLNRLAQTIGAESAEIIAISQDSEAATREFISQMQVGFPVMLDCDLAVTQQYDPMAVPTLFLV